MRKNKTKGILRNLKYINVEGIDTVYLDACLLAELDLDQLCKILEGEKQLLAKNNMNMLKLKKREVTKQELISKVSPYVANHYSLYNRFANMSYRLINLLEERFPDFSSLPLEEKANFLEELVQKGEMKYSTYINWLRFHEALHHRIATAFKQYAKNFEEDTGMFLAPSFHVKKEKEEQTGDDWYQKLTEVIESLTMIRDQVKQENFKEQCMEKQKEVELLQSQLNEVAHQLSSKDKQLAKQMRELNKLTKNLKEEQQKVEQKQKELGHLGQEVGKLRGRIEQLEKENQLLQREAEYKQAQLSQLKKDIEQQAENRWKIEKLKLQHIYEGRLEELESEIQSLQNQLSNIRQEFEQERNAYEEELKVLQRKVDLYEQMMKKRENEQNSSENGESAPVTLAKEPMKSDEWIDKFFEGLPLNEPEEVEE